MNNQYKGFKSWCREVDEYMNRIIGVSLQMDELNVQRLWSEYQKKIHPYYVSAREVIKTPEFIDGKVKESFVVPFEDRLTLVWLEDQ